MKKGDNIKSKIESFYVKKFTCTEEMNAFERVIVALLAGLCFVVIVTVLLLQV